MACFVRQVMRHVGVGGFFPAGRGTVLIVRTVLFRSAVSLGLMASMLLPGQTTGPGYNGEPGENDTFHATLGRQGPLPYEQTLMISGKVLMDDGAPPLEPVTANRVLSTSGSDSKKSSERIEFQVCKPMIDCR